VIVKTIRDCATELALVSAAFFVRNAVVLVALSVLALMALSRV
jgi:hypothetical protein